MTTQAFKTIIATGATSGLGFEVIRQLLITKPASSTAYKLILGCRDPSRTQAAFNELSYDTQKHKLVLLPLELSDLKGVKAFAKEAEGALGEDRLDYLFLNAGLIKSADEPGFNGSKYCESYIVNHLSQHYLIHLLEEQIVRSKTRVVVVSSGVITGQKETDSLESTLKAESGAEYFAVYQASKFVQLLGAHYWRRTLGDKATVLAVSPGMIPGTRLGRHAGFEMPKDAPDAKSVEEGAQSLLAAFTRSDFPADPNQIFLTSWGEYWPTEKFSPSLNKEVQNWWCPSKEEIEKEAGI